MRIDRWVARATVVAGGLLLSVAALAETLPVPANLISLGGEPGGQILLESTARQAYWPLSIQFVTQKNQSFCGVATMVMVLNALGVRAPPAPEIEPFTMFTQDNVLNEATERILPRATLMEEGMTLDQFGALMASHGVTTEVRHADKVSLEEFRAVASRFLGQTNHYVVVNYLRRAIGQERGGHISPLAAYDKNSDRFLVLDVSRYKYPPVWVKAAELHVAMNTPDADNEGRSRGYVLIGAASP